MLTLLLLVLTVLVFIGIVLAMVFTGGAIGIGILLDCIVAVLLIWGLIKLIARSK